VDYKEVEVVKRSPNLGMSIFLYSAGMLLILMAGLMLGQAFGWIKNVPETVIWALVLLSIGGGILMGMRNNRYG
jgi:hypothetical protein